jgi:hypothetical protein
MLAMVVLTCNPSYSGSEGKRMMSSKPVWKKVVKPYFKNNNKKKTQKG